MNKTEVWEQTKDICKKDLSPVFFNLWIEKLEIRSYSKDVVVLEAPYEFAKLVILKHFGKKIKSALQEVIGSPVELYMYSKTDPFFQKNDD